MTAFVVETLDERAPAPPAGRWRPPWALALGLVAAVAVALRLPYLATRSLWYDEASSWQTARFAPLELLRSVRLNVHMPLYYLLLKGWMAAFGESAAALRGFSVTFGALTVVAMGLFGREVYLASAAREGDPPDPAGRSAESFGTWLAILVALSPCQVFASIEARMYSLGTFLAATSGWLLLRALREGRGGRSWWAYGPALAALPYAHHYGLFTAAAELAFVGLYLVWLAGSGGGEEAAAVARRALVVAAFAVVVYLPGLDILRGQVERVRRDYWVRPLSWPIVFGTFNEFILPRPDYDQLPHGWVACAAFAASCAVVARRGRRGDGLVLALAVLPLGMAAAASLVTPVWVGRYFRFTQLFVLATVALAAWRATTGSDRLRHGLLATLAAGLLVADAAFWHGLDLANGRGVRGAVEYVMARRAPGEMIVALDATQYFPTKFHVAGRAPVRMIEPAFDLSWGWHLIRPGDLITAEGIDESLDRGIWIIGTPERPAVTSGLAALSPLEQSVFTYYNHLHARVYVHHYRRRGDRRP